MTITINGSGTITGATTMASATSFSSTVSAAGNVTLAGAAVKLLNNSGNPVVGQAGSILQVSQAVKTNTFTSASATWQDVTGWTVSITPTASTNKVMVYFSGYVSLNSGTGTYGMMVRLVRDSTTIFVGDARGSGQQASATAGVVVSHYAMPLINMYLDSPATTSAVTYKLQIYVETGGTALVGGSALSSAAYDSNVPTQITVMEVAA